MPEKIRNFKIYAASWLVDLLAMNASERGVYISICLATLNENRSIPVNDKQLPYMCGSTPRKFRVILDRLIGSRYLRIADGYIVSDRCNDVLAQERTRAARSNIRRAEIFERDGYRCTYCGDTEGPFHCDHIIPVSRGGSGDPSNLTTACASCNTKKGALTRDEWLGNSNIQ